MKRLVSIFTLAALPLAPLLAITPYSSGTVGTLNISGTNISANRSDITNPTQTLSATPTAIGFGAVGRNAATNTNARHFWQVSAFRVSDLLAAIGSSDPSDLANFTFTYTGLTEASTVDLPDTNEYRAAYLGQWTGTTAASATNDVPLTGTIAVPNSQNMTDTGNGAADTQRTLFGTAIETLSGYASAHAAQQVVDLNTVDEAGIAQTLTATGFNLSHLAVDLAEDTDLSDNYVLFSFHVDPKFAPATTGYAQAFTAISLVPVETAPKTISAGIYEVAGPNNTDSWGFGAGLTQSGGTIRFEIDGSGADQLLVTGDYNHSGGGIAIGLFAPPTIGTPVSLLRYSGTLTGTPGVTLEPGTRFTLNSGSPGDGTDDAVTATFAGSSASLFWTGLNGTAWDLATTTNWENEIGFVPETYFNVDAVNFDDMTTVFNPTLAGTVYPGSVKFINHDNDYTLRGPGVIAGPGTFTHAGSRKVTILSNNTFSGTTSVTNTIGVLQVGDGGTTGSLGTGAVALGGELIFKRSDTVTLPNSVTGSGSSAKMTLMGSGGVVITGSHSGTLGYDISTGLLRVGNGGNTGSLAAGASLNINAGTILEYFRSDVDLNVAPVISGSGTLSFKGTGSSLQSSYAPSADNTAFTGNVIVDDARVVIDDPFKDLGTASSVTLLSNSAIFLSAPGSFAYPIQLEGDGWPEASGQLGAIRLSNGVSVTGPVTLTGNSRIGCFGSSGNLAGNITESGGNRALELYSNNSTTDSTITLGTTTSASDYSGGTTVRGILCIARNSTSFGSGPVTVAPHPVNTARASGVFFDFTTVANNITTGPETRVLGNGGTTGNLVVEGLISPAGIVGTAVGTLRAGSLALQAGSTLGADINSSLAPELGRSDLLDVPSGAVTIAPTAALVVTDRASTPVALPNGSKITLINYTGGSLSGTFGGLPDGSQIVAGPNTFTLDYDDTSDTQGNPGKFVTLKVGGGSSFDQWAVTAGLDGSPGREAGFSDDPEGDGLQNGLEWILGGNPLANDPTPLVTTTGSATTGLTLVFNRNPDSIGATILSVEWDSDLSGGFANNTMIGTTDVGPIGEAPTVDLDAPSPGKVTVTIPAANAVGGKLLARLKATLP